MRLGQIPKQADTESDLTFFVYSFPPWNLDGKLWIKKSLCGLVEKRLIGHNLFSHHFEATCPPNL